MSEVTEAIAAHVKDQHLGLDRAAIQKAFDEHRSLMDNGRKLDLLVDDWFGPPVIGIDGEVTRRHGWRDSTVEFFDRTDDRLDRLEHHMRNGGVPARLKLTRGQAIALTAAVAPVLAASIGAIANFLSG